MCFRKSLFISSFLLFLIPFLFSFSKISFAQTCNESGGLCIPQGQETALCTDPKIGGTIKLFTDPNQPSGCANNGSCCVGGNNTCAQNKGTCGPASSCTNGTTDKKFLCEGGTDNVCCIPSATTTTTTQTTQTSNTSTQAALAQYYGNYIDNSTNKVSSENWLSNASDNNILWATKVLIGNSIPTSANTAFVPGGLMGVTTNAIASLYNPPASGIQYLAQLKDNFLGKPAYAQQGTGFVSLQPILPIWRGFRNVVYIISSLIFIVIGLLIMLRIKISPQAVITIQSAIPQIIITLILVTFSYAIAGLLIDLSYLIQNFAIAILFQTQANGLKGTMLPSTNSPGTFSNYANGGMGMIFGLMWRALPFRAIASLGGIISGIVGGIAGGVGTIAFLTASAGSIAPGAAIGIVLFLLVLLIIMVIWLIKFWFGLIKCYVIIIFKIVLAPLEIGMGAFPNMKIGFSSWITDLVANLAVFPISYLFLIIANIIIDKTTHASLWIPNLLSSNTVNNVTSIAGLVQPVHAADVLTGGANLVAGASGGLVPACIGLATLGIVSKLPQMIPEFIFQIKPSPWGKAIGETYGALPIVSSGYKNISKTVGEKFGSAMVNIKRKSQPKEEIPTQTENID
jgi:hypothetical protein